MAITIIILSAIIIGLVYRCFTQAAKFDNEHSRLLDAETIAQAEKSAYKDCLSEFKKIEKENTELLRHNEKLTSRGKELRKYCDELFKTNENLARSQKRYKHLYEEQKCGNAQMQTTIKNLEIENKKLNSCKCDMETVVTSLDVFLSKNLISMDGVRSSVEKIKDILGS